MERRLPNSRFFFMRIYCPRTWTAVSLLKMKSVFALLGPWACQCVKPTQVFDTRHPLMNANFLIEWLGYLQEPDLRHAIVNQHKTGTSYLIDRALSLSVCHVGGVNPSWIGEGERRRLQVRHEAYSKLVQAKSSLLRNSFADSQFLGSWSWSTREGQLERELAL